MSLVPARNLTISAPVLRARFSARGRDDAYAFNTLDGEDSVAARACAGQERRRAPSQSGTQPDSPIWNSARLDSAFVAQVLGQVTAAAPASALAPYRHAAAQIPPGALFDIGA
jgi:hypothetical protein